MSAADEPRPDEAAAAAMAEAIGRRDAEMAAEARAVLEAGGCEAVRIEGSGASWHVWCGYNPGEFFVNAWSAKNPATPNDPVYLARSALATLERNEKPRPRAVRVARPTERERLLAKLRAQFGPESSPRAPVAAAMPTAAPQETAHSAAHVAPEPAQEGAEWAEAHSVETLEPAPEEPDDISDAVFDELNAEDFPPVDLLALDDLSAADDPALEDFSAPPEAEAPEMAEGGPEFIFGPPADHLETLRSQRIGDVVRISRTKQDAIWELAGTTEHEFRDLTGQVMHDTINGQYKGPSGLFERFNELQLWANRAAEVQFAERTKVTFLTNADRPDVEAFDAEADWPNTGEGEQP